MYPPSNHHRSLEEAVTQQRISEEPTRRVPGSMAATS